MFPRALDALLNCVMASRWATVSVTESVTNQLQPRTIRRPPADILRLNAWLRDYAGKVNATYADYYAAIVDPRGFLREGFSEDGLHPNVKGYELMAPVAQRSIDQAVP